MKLNQNNYRKIIAVKIHKQAMMTQIIKIIERFFEIFSKQHYNYNEFVYWN